MSIKTHQFVLHFGSVPVLTRLMDPEHQYRRGSKPANDSGDSGETDSDGPRKIRIELNFSQFTDEVVRFFFGLIYYNELRDALQRPEQQEELAYIEENVLQLHQLACYFGFTALQELCQERSYRLFSLGSINQISGYCLHPLSSEQGGHYWVPDDKRALYTKLMHWYQLCTDDAVADGLFPGGHNTDYDIEMPRPRRHSGSGSNISNKTVVLSQKKSHVQDFNQFQLPVAGIDHHHDGDGYDHRTRLTHYRRVCAHCISHPSLIHKKENGIINMGTVSDGAGDAWSFSMMHKLGNNTSMMLFLKHRSAAGATTTSYSSQSDDEHMSVESGSNSSSHEGIKIQSQVRLFSTQPHDIVRCDELETGDRQRLGELTRISHFQLHPEEDCYEGQCDCCQHQQNVGGSESDGLHPVYIFCITVDIIK